MSTGDGRLTGQRVLLTGATGGVGQATADRLSRGGAELVLLGRRREVLEELESRLKCRVIAGDIRDRAFMEGLIPRLPPSWQAAPDVLINNAGVFTLAPLTETSPEAFREHLDVNLLGAFDLIRVCMPGMLERGSGHLVNVGSVAGRQAFPGNVAYSASKYGLRGLHEVLVAELQGSGLRATWIEPSAVDTPLWDPLDPEGREDLPSREDMLRPGAVAEAIFFAVSQPDDVSIQEIVIRANAATGGS